MSLLDRLTQLAARVPRVGMRVDGSPPEGLDWEEVAGALAVMDGPQRDLLRGMYLGDARSMRAALARLQGVAFGRVAEVGDRYIGVHAVVAMKAFVAQGQCPACNGRRTVMVGELKVTCDKCEGSGVAVPPLAAMLREEHGPAEAINVALVEQLMDVLALWHSDGWRTLGRQLREE